jgi:sulfate adenylyltransferase subunit 2
MPRILGHLEELEAESIHILREVAAGFARPVLLYSVGKDSSVLVRLAKRAFYPGRMPFGLLHIDTGYKFSEMIDFRDRFCADEHLDLIVFRSQEGLGESADPFRLGTQRCCGLLKTGALLKALESHKFDAAMGGARRDEEKSRAKERMFSLRDEKGQWDPRQQRPEIWNLYNVHIGGNETMRVFPLSNWTELDIWEYIDREEIPVVPLYFAKPRPMVERGAVLLPIEHGPRLLPGEHSHQVMCRMRTLGCTYCTGAVRSTAATVPQILEELRTGRHSERQHRLIDHDQDGSMEQKKREGYF